MTAYHGWAMLELMGHRVRFGEVSEVEMAGAKLLRIDCPVYGDEGEPLPGLTEFYGGAAVYCLTPCSEDVARQRARHAGNPHPISPLRHRLAAPAHLDGEYAEFDLENRS